jgi:diguanylate cyclase (GGDEF)-like protein
MDDNDTSDLERQVSVLLIEDDEDDFVLVKALLAEIAAVRFELEWVTEYSHALARLTQGMHDVCLLDYRLGVHNGLELLREAINNGCAKPIIVLTGQGDYEIDIEAMKAGASDYLAKDNISVPLLERSIRYSIQQKQVEQELKRYQDRLEELVKERTEQLKMTNELLLQEIKERLRAERALQNVNEELKRLANLDGLTKVGNRRRFDEYLQQSWRVSLREQRPLSLIICDVDYFKVYNDTYGHQAGDDCLCAVSRAISHSARRPADLVARYGGEEFAVLLPNTSAEGAVEVAEAIRLEVEELKIPHDQCPISKVVSVSLGVSALVPYKEIQPELLIALADKALYEAKHRGRNCVRVRVPHAP